MLRNDNKMRSSWRFNNLLGDSKAQPNGQCSAIPLAGNIINAYCLSFTVVLIAIENMLCAPEGGICASS